MSREHACGFPDDGCAVPVAEILEPFSCIRVARSETGRFLDCEDDNDIMKREDGL